MVVLAESCLAAWTLMTLVVFSTAVIGKVGLGMLRAYYILRVRAGKCKMWHVSFRGLDNTDCLIVGLSC